MTGRKAGKCDLCCASLEVGDVIWTHFTPSTGTLEEAEDGKAFWAEDPEWALCGLCHENVQKVDADELTDHMFLLLTMQRLVRNDAFVVIGPDAKELRDAWMKHAGQTLMLFLHNRIPEYREEVNCGVSPDGKAE